MRSYDNPAMMLTSGCSSSASSMELLRQRNGGRIRLFMASIS